MATGYTSAWSKSSPFSGKIRVYWSTSFNSSTRISTVSITPQFQDSVNGGSDYRLYSGGTSGAGLYGDGTCLWTLGSNYGSGNYAKCGSCNKTWASFNKTVSFTVSHGDDGKATFTVGVLGSVRRMYDSKVITGIGGKASSSITVTEAAKTYSVTYNANGGEGAPSSQTKTYNVALTLSSTVPTRSGYNFLGWATSSSATTAEYQPGASYTTNAALALFAVWESAGGTVHIDDGTSFATYNIYIDNGSTWDQYVPYIDTGSAWEVYS